MTAVATEIEAGRAGAPPVAREVATLWPGLFGAGVCVPLKLGIDKLLAVDAARRGSAKRCAEP